MAVIKWSLNDIEDVCSELKTNLLHGLSSREAKKRLHHYGGNILKEEKRRSAVGLFINQFRDFMVLVLIGATLISAILGEYTDAVTIMIIVFLNALLGFIQESRAEKSLEALKKLNAPLAHVVREGKVQKISVSEVVQGDLVLLSEGDRVPADVRLTDCQNLAVNEASLTGESDMVQKTDAVLSAAPGSLGEYENIAFMSTLVVRGHGAGIVTATGMDTQMGRIAYLIQSAEEEDTPLQQKLASLGKMLVAGCLAVCAVVILLGIWQGESWYKMLMAGVSLAVAAIPEGLPAIVTVSLALGVQRMIRRRAVVRRLPAVETLGCASVICSDKTGTLTENKMKVVRISAGGKTYSLPRSRNSRNAFSGRNIAALDKVFETAVFCNNARLIPNEGVQGEPTEAALLEAAVNCGYAIPAAERIRENTFTSRRKMMSAAVRRSGRMFIYCKGAPEVILNLCSKVLVNGREISMSEKEYARLKKQVEDMAGEALRSLAVAYRPLLPGDEKKPWDGLETNLIFAGILGMEDPPRMEVKEAVSRCRRAGIRTVMITGDHASTARAIAGQLGIIPPGGKVLTGKDLDAMGERSLKKIVNNVYVYARVSPEHKLRIVKALKSNGEIVAMTGDGINDAPAVKEANIGIAMGKSGTDVTREAAALVLSDDNFITIAAAVEEGRNIFNNIRKFIRFLLAGNIGEILTMLLAMIIGLPLPLRPIQLLWINLVTDGLPAAALGVDHPDRRIMERPPRSPSEGVFTAAVWKQIIGRGIYIGVVTVALFALVLEATSHLLLAQTMSFSTLVMCQLSYVFECRREKGGGFPPINYFLYAAVFSSLLLLFLVIYYPPFQRVFQTAALSLQAWLIIFCFSLIPAFVNIISRAGVIAYKPEIKSD